MFACAVDTPQVRFPFGAKEEGFDDIDGRSAFQFSLARIKDFYWGAAVGTEAMCYLDLCRTSSSVALEKGLKPTSVEWPEGFGSLQPLMELFVVVKARNQI